MSREALPKQFLSFGGERTLFQETALRSTAFENSDVEVEKPLIVAGAEHRFIIDAQLREINVIPTKLILEPFPKNTAPALTLAALAAMETGKDPILLVMPADHRIAMNISFTGTLLRAFSEASDNKIVVLGVTPTRPETGYGYIKTKLNARENVVSDVIAFKEKPDTKTAATFFDDPSYFWNSGIFVLKASVWISALERFRSEILFQTQQSWKKQVKDSFISWPDQQLFDEIPSDSIDFAVMEHSAKGFFETVMIELESSWTDLGSWHAVWEDGIKDESNNVISGDVFSVRSSNNLVYNPNKLVSLVNVANLAVIETPDAILVAGKNSNQDIKDLVEVLSEQGRDEVAFHRKVQRPWGWYDSIEEGEAFKVKRIFVHPGESLSRQKHKHRSEHWVVIRGVAEVEIESDVLTLEINQSAYIPRGAIHRLSNRGEVPVEVIEVQCGDYLGEDDIIRLEDDYGRV